jgi:hypothetical protein
MMRGILLGTVAGLALGLVIDNQREPCSTGPCKIDISPIVFVPLGAAIGGIIGSRKTDDWRPVDGLLERAGLGVAPGAVAWAPSRGVRVAVSFAFQ